MHSNTYIPYQPVNVIFCLHGNELMAQMTFMSRRRQLWP